MIQFKERPGRTEGRKDERTEGRLPPGVQLAKI